MHVSSPGSCLVVVGTWQGGRPGMEEDPTMAACRNGKGNGEKQPNEASYGMDDDLITSLLLYFTVVRSCTTACACDI